MRRELAAGGWRVGERVSLLGLSPWSPWSLEALSEAPLESRVESGAGGVPRSAAEPPRVAEPGPSESPRGWPGNLHGLAELLRSSQLRGTLKAYGPSSTFTFWGFFMEVCGTLSISRIVVSACT